MCVYALLCPHSRLTRLHDNVTGQHSNTHRVGALLPSHPGLQQHTGGSWQGHPRFTRADHDQKAVGGSTAQHGMRKKSQAPQGVSTAERHTTTASSDATGDQPKNWRATIQEPVRHHDSVHSLRSGAGILQLLTTVEDDTDGTDEDNIIDTATAAKVSGSLQLTTTDSEQAPMTDLRPQPVSNPLRIRPCVFQVIQDTCARSNVLSEA